MLIGPVNHQKTMPVRADSCDFLLVIYFIIFPSKISDQKTEANISDLPKSSAVFLDGSDNAVSAAAVNDSSITRLDINKVTTLSF